MTNTWIVTIGSSDIQITNQGNWQNLYRKARGEDSEIRALNFGRLSEVPNTRPIRYTAPPRLIGRVYQMASETVLDNDLEYPLLDSFVQYLQDKNIQTIVPIFTDQSQVFNSESITQVPRDSPFWQDTSEIEFIICRYMQKKFQGANVKPLRLIAQAGERGVDHWDETLRKLQNIEWPQIFLEESGELYVSHQAGTPALSSAVQFVCLSKYEDTVNFLVSNQYSETVEKISSSRYLYGIRKQQAKRLLVDGAPGAAQSLLQQVDSNVDTYQQLQTAVSFFNLTSRRDPNARDFTVGSSTERINYAVELIDKFLQKGNYLQGITLLSAAQETFLKTALLKVFKDNRNITLDVGNKKIEISVFQLLGWTPKGLYFKHDDQIKRVLSIKNNGYNLVNRAKIDFLMQMDFPETLLQSLEDKYLHNSISFRSFGVTNENHCLHEWLKNLNSQFSSWLLLSWSCMKGKRQDADRRNQLMHNLRGIERQDANRYLLGIDDDDQKIYLDPSGEQINFESCSVSYVYKNYVKKPFYDALDTFNLPYIRGFDLDNWLSDIANTLD